jgi:hypothetical protein
MKKIIAFLFCGVMTLMTFGWAGAENSGTVNPASSEKLYISPENLHFYDQSMFVFTGEAWQQISAVYSDAGGLFVQRIPDSDTWYCRKCKAYHSYDKGCPEE